MPDQDGLETIRELRVLNPDVKILAISGGGRLDYKLFLDTAKTFGADLSLRKPFRASWLTDAVAQLIVET